MTKMKLNLVMAIAAMAILGNGCGMLGMGPARRSAAPPKRAAKKSPAGIEFINKTGAPVCELYTSQSARYDSKWGQNILAAGQKIAVDAAFSKPYPGHLRVKLDVKAVGCDGKVLMRDYSAHTIYYQMEKFTLAPKDEGEKPVMSAPRAAASAGSNSESVTVVNKCSSKVAYCIVDGSSTEKLEISGNSSTDKSLSKGAQITQRSGSSCGAALYTATRMGKSHKLVICK